MTGFLIGGFLGDFFKFIGESFLLWLYQILNTLTLALLVPIYYLFSGIMTIALFAETAFKKLAGIDTIYLNGQGYSGGSGTGKDLVYAFITDATVQNVFWSILALSFVLLFIFTIVALIKSEFAIDLKASAKGPIFARAFKSLANFIVVPAATIISIIGVNFITKSVNDLFGGEESTVVSKCFVLGAYNANRVRYDENFYEYIKNGDYIEDGSGSNPFAGNTQEEVAAKVDYAFESFGDYNIEFKSYNYATIFQFADLAYRASQGEYIPFHAANSYTGGGNALALPTGIVFLPLGSGGQTHFSMWKINQVHFFYNLWLFDWILAFGSAIAMTWLLFTVCLVLVKRVFEMAILFLLAPAMTAIAPLDAGAAEKKWRQEFMKRLLGVLGPVFAYNMFFLLVPLFENIELFGSGSTLIVGANTFGGGSSLLLGDLGKTIMSFIPVFDIAFQIICIIVGLSVIKSASALLSNLLGIEDLIKSGEEAGKKAIQKGQGAVRMAKTTVGFGVRMAGTAADYIKKKAIDKKTGAGESRKKAKAELDKKKGAVAQKQADKANEAYDDAMEEGVKGWEAANSEGTWEVTEDGDSVLKEGKASRLKELEKHSEEGKITNDEQDELIKLRRERDDYAEKSISKGIKDEKERANTNLEYRKQGISAEKQKEIEDYNKEMDEKIAAATTKEEKNRLETEKAKKYAKFRDAAGDDKTAREKNWGVGSDKNNFFYRMYSGIESGEGEFGNNFLAKAYNKLSKAPIIRGQMKTWMETKKKYHESSGVGSDTNSLSRRWNDAFADMMGDSGGGDLWKLWFNKNARAKLFEGLPESKAREQGIQQGLLQAARDRYAKDEAQKAAEKEQQRTLARMIGKEVNNPEYKSLFNARTNAERMGDNLRVQELDAQIDKFNDKHGYTAQAKELLKQPGFMQSDRYKSFKKSMEEEAHQEAVKNSISDREKTQTLNAKFGATLSDKPQNVKQSDEERQKQTEAFEKMLQRALQKGVKFDAKSLEDLATVFTEGGEKMANSFVQALAEALKQLPKNN